MPNRPTRETNPHREEARRLTQRLRDARLAAGISQQELAQRAGISYGTVRAIEGGRVVDPGFFTVSSLVRALGIEPADLF